METLVLTVFECITLHCLMLRKFVYISSFLSCTASSFVVKFEKTVLNEYISADFLFDSLPGDTLIKLDSESCAFAFDESDSFTRHLRVSGKGSFLLSQTKCDPGFSLFASGTIRLDPEVCQNYSLTVSTDVSAIITMVFVPIALLKPLKYVNEWLIARRMSMGSASGNSVMLPGSYKGGAFLDLSVDGVVVPIAYKRYVKDFFKQMGFESKMVPVESTWADEQVYIEGRIHRFRLRVTLFLPGFIFPQNLYFGLTDPDAVGIDELYPTGIYLKNRDDTVFGKGLLNSVQSMKLEAGEAKLTFLPEQYTIIPPASLSVANTPLFNAPSVVIDAGSVLLRSSRFGEPATDSISFSGFDIPMVPNARGDMQVVVGGTPYFSFSQTFPDMQCAPIKKWVRRADTIEQLVATPSNGTFCMLSIILRTSGFYYITKKSVGAMSPQVFKKGLIGNIEIIENLDEKECVICLNDIGAHEGILPCKHSFHPMCIYEWHRHKSTCPSCRST